MLGKLDTQMAVGIDRLAHAFSIGATGYGSRSPGSMTITGLIFSKMLTNCESQTFGSWSKRMALNNAFGKRGSHWESRIYYFIKIRLFFSSNAFIICFETSTDLTPTFSEFWPICDIWGVVKSIND